MTGHPVPDGWPARAIAVACITSVVSLHAFRPRWGLRLTNALGIFKVLVLLLIICTGLGVLSGAISLAIPGPRPDSLSPGNFWTIERGDGYGGGGAYAYATALLQVVYSYKGWENANYVLGELKNPRRTLSVAAPLAVVGVTVLYVLANVAYFAAIPKGDIARSEVIVAGLFFRNVFGAEGWAARMLLPAMVACSNVGNVLAVSFAHARVNRELARERIVPFSDFWAKSWRGTPAGGVSLVCSLVLLLGLSLTLDDRDSCSCTGL